MSTAAVIDLFCRHALTDAVVALADSVQPASITPDAIDIFDRQLIEQARTGDPRAFRALVRRYEGTVARIAVGMLGPGPDAEDIGQEAMLKLYESLGDFRGDAGLATYLTRITINLCLRALRRRKTWLHRFISADPQDPVFDVAGHERPDRDTEREQSRVVVMQALQRLSPEERAVVVLRLLQGCSTRETAGFLRIAEGTVMSRLSRALARLRPLLAMLKGPIDE